MRFLVVCMSCLCVWLGKLSVLVSADYVVQVEMVSYSHPSNTRSVGVCCDPEPGFGPCRGDERCDTYFAYCLMPRASTAIVCPNTAPGFFAISPTTAQNGATIDFSEPTVLGLPNPFNLTGLTTSWEGAHQLFMQVGDFDSFPPFIFDSIARYRFDPSLSVGLPTTLPTSPSASPSISVSVTVLCAPFYSGSSCEIFNHCESNAVTCSDRGTCVNGFTSSTCDCDPRYAGANCESQNFCFNRNCNDRGTCNNGVDSYTCVCDPGYTGADCEGDIDECLLMESVFSGHGNCSHGIATFTCSCDPGYTGQRCETDIDDCVNLNCSGQGNCTDRVNGFDCDCFPGYTDTICQTDIDECDGINCSGNGGCVDMVNMFLCDCEPGYTGADCETNIDDCENRNCSGNGVCVDGVNSFSCECVSGFTGEMCTQEARSDGATAAIAGGVVGGLVGIVLTAVLVVVIVIFIILKNKQDSSKYNFGGGGTVDNDNNMDNPVYGVCETKPQPNTLPTGPPSSSLQEHEFDNPLYDMSEPLPPVYESVDERLTSSSYATIAEREDGLGHTSDIYDDVNMRQ